MCNVHPWTTLLSSLADADLKASSRLLKQLPRKGLCIAHVSSDNLSTTSCKQIAKAAFFVQLEG
jgi:hypothetical protein